MSKINIETCMQFLIPNSSTLNFITNYNYSVLKTKVYYIIIIISMKCYKFAIKKNQGSLIEIKIWNISFIPIDPWDIAVAYFWW